MISESLSSSAAILAHLLHDADLSVQNLDADSGVQRCEQLRHAPDKPMYNRWRRNLAAWASMISGGSSAQLAGLKAVTTPRTINYVGSTRGPESIRDDSVQKFGQVRAPRGCMANLRVESAL